MIEPMLADLADAARRPSAAEQLAARVAGHAHCPVLLRTLHIGGAHENGCFFRTMEKPSPIKDEPLKHGDNLNMDDIA